MPSSSTTLETFPMLPTIGGFDGFNNDFMPELGLTSLFDLDQSREIQKTSFKPTESMKQPEDEQIIEIQEPENTRKTFSISRPRLVKENSDPPPTRKQFGISKPKLAEADAKGTYVKPNKIKKMSRTKLSTYPPTLVTTDKSVSWNLKPPGDTLRFGQ